MNKEDILEQIGNLKILIKELDFQKLLAEELIERLEEHTWEIDSQEHYDKVEKRDKFLEQEIETFMFKYSK